MIGHLLSRAVELPSAFSFVARNIVLAWNMTKVEPTTGRGFRIRGMIRADERQVLELYSSLNDGEHLSRPRRLLYRIAGDKLMFLAVAEGTDGVSLVGMNMYYFNKRDVDEGTIHSGFIGVRPAMTRRGVATALRVEAGRHFAANHVAGISARISFSNSPSLISAQRSGFVPIETYYDADLKGERYYLIRRLEPPR